MEETDYDKLIAQLQRLCEERPAMMMQASRLGRLAREMVSQHSAWFYRCSLTLVSGSHLRLRLQRPTYPASLCHMYLDFTDDSDGLVYASLDIDRRFRTSRFDVSWPVEATASAIVAIKEFMSALDHGFSAIPNWFKDIEGVRIRTDRGPIC